MTARLIAFYEEEQVWVYRDQAGLTWVMNSPLL